MEDEWVTTSSNIDKNKVTNYTEVFNKQFPYYLAMGMSEQEYWWGDNDYPKLYEKAYSLKEKMVDKNAWVNGAYIYAALCRVAPVLHAFAKKGTKPEPYLELPITFTNDEEVLKEKERKEMEKMKDDFKAKMQVINQRLKGGKSNG